MLANQIVHNDNEVLEGQGSRPGEVQQGPGNRGDRDALQHDNVSELERRAVADDAPPPGSRGPVPVRCSSPADGVERAITTAPGSLKAWMMAAE